MKVVGRVQGMSMSFVLILCMVTFLGCRTGTTVPEETFQAPTSSSALSSRNADDLVIVDCLLPGQVRKLGKMTYLSARRPIKTSAFDCEIRGGEYVAYDRSNLVTALNVWLPGAREGDKVAQTYVGEIYQQASGVNPKYDLAAQWFQKAAEQGYARAQINLAYLYEKGLGVQRDPAKAIDLYRKAGGLDESITLAEEPVSIEERQELEELRRQVESLKKEAETLQHQLERNRQKLDRSSQELKQRKLEAEAERKKLEKARTELDRRMKRANETERAKLKEAETVLSRREAELRTQREEATRLKSEIARLETEDKAYRKKLSDYKQQLADIPGPKIEVIDPQIVATRGIHVAATRPGMASRDIVGRVIAPAGLFSVTVNERPGTVGSNGMFKVAVPVKKSGKSEVTIVAVDSQGKRADLQFMLEPELRSARDASATNEVPSVRFGRYYALVIGNNAYTKLPKLETPLNDAKRTAEVLKDRYGFETTVLLNVTRYDILAALNSFREKLTEKDNFLIYYAGHGELDKKNKRGYWLPVDADPDSTANWVSTLSITDILNIMSARKVIVIADTCYSGIMTRSAIASLEPGKSEEVKREWLNTMATKRSRTVLSSGELKPVLDAGGGDHSVFARAFLDVLGVNNEILDGMRLYREVSALVSYSSERFGLQQVPQYAALIHGGHESGDFLFVPAN